MDFLVDTYLSCPSDDRKRIARDVTRQSDWLAFLDHDEASGRNRFNARRHYHRQKQND